jgi:hypothetical protein
VPETWHEYALLLRDVFPTLPSSEQQLVLSWVGGDDRAQVRQLYPIKEAIPPEWQERYRGLIEALGISENETAVPQSARRAPESPLSIDQINEIPVADVAQYLSREGDPRTIVQTRSRPSPTR